MILILHNIRSLYNVGSIFRTADAAGIEKIYLCGITPKPVDEFGRSRERLAKVSLGAEKYVEWEYAKNTVRLIDKLKKAKPRSERSSTTWGKYKIFSVEQSKKSIPYYKISSVKRHGSCKKIALVLGNEVKGLPLSILKRSDKILEIPMKGKKESLNVGVAFGIVAFHFISK
ncbi:TrmH family RNA methyltransferase [Candidatus Peregrinibacteria bacterium]|nr:TrmH family RNA methyltransferase [Candidatus Peregrinibacteria bacterium]